LAAATAHRGVRHIRLPTTTLSQCDSGVGIKNAINACGKKNFAGTFCPPFAVINDFTLLGTLPPRHKRAGYAEAVKVACIRDASYFAWIECQTPALRAFEPEAMGVLIRRCAELHLAHIAGSGDPFELGSARPLDFGHWAAHKLEQLTVFCLSHGEAVAIGLALDVVYSRLRGFLPPAQCERVLRILEGLGFRLFAAEVLQLGQGGGLALLDGLEEFREHLGGHLTVTLLKDIGSGFETHEMDPACILQAVDELRLRDLARQDLPVAENSSG
jgi:3-dehydroquinate synthase